MRDIVSRAGVPVPEWYALPDDHVNTKRIAPGHRSCRPEESQTRDLGGVGPTMLRGDAIFIPLCCLTRP